MADKSKISHFTPTSTLDSKSGNNNEPDRSRLARLYPDPKNYEQIKEDDKLRLQSYRRHWPKYPYLNIATYGSFVFAPMVWFAQNLKSWWLGGSNDAVTISMVFYSFTIWLVVAAMIIAWVIYVNRQFSYFGGMVGLFWSIYGVLVTLLFVLLLSGLIWDYANILWILVLSSLHFVVVLTSAWRIIKS